MAAVVRVAFTPVRAHGAVLGECGPDPRVAKGQLLPWAGPGLCPQDPDQHLCVELNGIPSMSFTKPLPNWDGGEGSSGRGRGEEFTFCSIQEPQGIG